MAERRKRQHKTQTYYRKVQEFQLTSARLAEYRMAVITHRTTTTISSTSTTISSNNAVDIDIDIMHVLMLSVTERKEERYKRPHLHLRLHPQRVRASNQPL